MLPTPNNAINRPLANAHRSRFVKYVHVIRSFSTCSPVAHRFDDPGILVCRQSIPSAIFVRPALALNIFISTTSQTSLETDDAYLVSW